MMTVQELCEQAGRQVSGVADDVARYEAARDALEGCGLSGLQVRVLAQRVAARVSS